MLRQTVTKNGDAFTVLLNAEPRKATLFISPVFDSKITAKITLEPQPGEAFIGANGRLTAPSLSLDTVSLTGSEASEHLRMARATLDLATHFHAFLSRVSRGFEISQELSTINTLSDRDLYFSILLVMLPNLFVNTTAKMGVVNPSNTFVGEMLNHEMLGKARCALLAHYNMPEGVQLTSSVEACKFSTPEEALFRAQALDTMLHRFIQHHQAEWTKKADILQTLTSGDRLKLNSLT